MPKDLQYRLENINICVYMCCVYACMYVESNVYICMTIKCFVFYSYSWGCKDGEFWYISWFKLLNAEVHVLQSHIATNKILECKWKLEMNACKHTPKNEYHMPIANLQNQVKISLNGLWWIFITSQFYSAR